MNTRDLSTWARLHDELHADCRIFKVRKSRFHRRSDQKEGDFFVLDTNDWVNVLALTKCQELVMVRQFRFGTEAFSLEPPGGVVEKGESPVLAGERELEEEPLLHALLRGLAPPDLLAVQVAARLVTVAFTIFEELVCTKVNVNSFLLYSLSISRPPRSMSHLRRAPAPG